MSWGWVGGRGAPMGWTGLGMALEHEQGRGGLGGGGDEVGIQMGWLESRGKERGRWNTNRVAVVARGAVEGEGGRALEYR